MANIFNLFLFLFALWICFMLAAAKLSWLYIFFGILASGLISIASFRLKLIEEKSELLYLSLGFYRHFLKIFLQNFISAINLIIDLSITEKPLHPLIYEMPLPKKNNFNLALLIASLNMTSGLLFIGMKDEKLLIHAINENFFKKFHFKKICFQLEQINDDNLV